MRCNVHLAFFSVFAAVAITEEIGVESPGESYSTTRTISSRLQSSDIRCCNTKVVGSKTKWVCRGEELLTVPSNLTVKTREMILEIHDAGIEVLQQENLEPYVEVLTELKMYSCSKFKTLKPGIFNNTKKLRLIYIHNAKSLTRINEGVFQVRLPRLRSIHIINSGLLNTPYLGKLITNNVMDTVDFHNNEITSINKSDINISVDQLIFTSNKIQFVNESAFAGSEISELYLNHNEELKILHPNAFTGLKTIILLDLSNTSITLLPTSGLENLKKLRINHTTTLRKFPSVYSFRYITEADLTYPYHCCAFEHPAINDPDTALKFEKLEKKSKIDCAKEREEFGLENKTIPPEMEWKLPSCRKVNEFFKNVTCNPQPDGFSPCKDIMDNSGLRTAAWFVAISAIIGNLVVLLVLVSSRLRMTVPKFLMCNLAFSDICMGIYLTIIVIIDARTYGVYFTEAIDWQNGPGCQIAGVLTVFSTELSVFTLMLITIERWYTIKYAIHLDRRLRLRTAVRIMVVGWFYAGSMALLPLFGISSYARTSLCLPLDRRNTQDLIYLGTLLVFNCFTFVLIVICYGYMYSSIKEGSKIILTSMARSDAKIARKMAILVFTDFACWAPIAFFGITALAGSPLIDLTWTKYLLVFFYPLNSLANPYLYAILTRPFRQEALILLARYGIYKVKVNGSRSDRNLTANKSKQQNAVASADPGCDLPATLSDNLNDRFQSSNNGVAPAGDELNMKDIVCYRSSGSATSPA